MIRTLGRGVAILVTTALAASLPAAVAHAGTPDSATAPRALRPLLSAPRHGAAAIAELGHRLGSAAAVNDLSGPALRTLLRSDPSAWVATTGQVYFREPSPQPTVLAAARTVVAPKAAVSTTTRVAALHSDALSTHKIYLDFAGVSLVGTAWNALRSLTSLITRGFDVDGHAATFTPDEQSRIKEIWREVAAIYAPFDIDVTTENPGLAGLIRSTAADDTYGIRVVVTSDPLPSRLFCAGCSGISWMSTFDTVDPAASYRDAWVFADSLGEDPMLVAQTVAHEAGHTFGLHHDGDASGEYARGNGNWHPLMGYATNRPISQFSRGEYAGATNHEDDIAIIAAGGAPLRPDTVGDTIATATPLTSAVDGLVNTRADVDVYSLPTGCAGPVAITARGSGHGSPLDLALDLLDSHGWLIRRANPPSGETSDGYASGLDASLRTTLTGRTYVRVSGVGAGNPYTTNRKAIGYSDYGSIGDYRLTMSGCTAAARSTPGRPVVTSVRPGAPGGARTIVAHWRARAGTTSHWQVRVAKVAAGAAVRRWSVHNVRLSSHSASYRLAPGRYVVSVRAVGPAGSSTWSPTSRAVRAR